jgi:cytochrome c553
VKKILSTLLAVAFVAVASSALAAPPTEVDLPAKPGNVHFDHKAHQAKGCKKCHGDKVEKITLDKDSAHKLCVECHKAEAKGPTKCAECHKKA